MVTITLSVPDEIAAQIASHRSNLPALLLEAIELADKSSHPNVLLFPENHELLDETIDLITSRPTPGEILAFKYSPQAQSRLQELADKNREETLQPNERAELELYSQMNHLMVLIKARARQMLSTPN